MFTRQNFKQYFHSFSPAVRAILVALVATYLLFALLARTPLGYWTYDMLSLRPHAVFSTLQIWRLFTYAVLHDLGSPFHLIFNGLMLFFLGPELEHRWGSRRFLIFIALTTLGGSIFVCLSWLFGLSQGPVIGFSAATIGLLIAWGLIFSKRPILAFGLIPLTGMQIVWATVVIQFIYAIGSSNISSAAHFGGMSTAAILTLGWWRPSRLKALFVQHKPRSFR